MKKILELITIKFTKAFEACGYDSKYAKVTVSNRPDLCEYQCNGAMAAAKEYKKAPIMIANEIVSKVGNDSDFSEIAAVNPGFINIKVSSEFLDAYVNVMASEDKLGLETISVSKKVVIDYGGANVAKPLHVGHLRPAIIGESVKRICRFMGDDVTGDVHLGDWGLQIGLIIEELKIRKPDLVYFDESYAGDYPKEAPFTISELEEIYPAASAKSKIDDEFREKAQLATLKLQNQEKAYYAIWKHIMEVSIKDLKKNYENLDVHFDLWKGESDALPYIPDMIEDLIQRGIAYESQGAIVVDITMEGDKKEFPPCIVRKQNGASLYATADLATIIEREKLYKPDQYIYVTDKRQELYFTQVFRTARKAGYVKAETKLDYLGHGTMNGKDGRPFKTRDGGTMRLETLIGNIEEAVYNKIIENRQVEEREARDTAKIIALAALKYGDLSNQISKDYVFDIDRFTSFEGNTGPYILYTIVRIKSILDKYNELTKDENQSDSLIKDTGTENEKVLKLELSKFSEMMDAAYQELAPNKICAYIYDLSNTFNKFYHDTIILTEEDKEKQASYINLIKLTKKTLEICIDLIGVKAPHRM